MYELFLGVWETAKDILIRPGRSLKEFRLLTSRTNAENVMSKVSLKSRLCCLPKTADHIYLNIPFISAAMQAVSCPKLAVALAQFGGLSVLPCSLPAKDVVMMVEEVKRYKAGFQENVVTLTKDQLISEAVQVMNSKGYHKFPITDDGLPHGKLIGMLSDRNFDPKDHAQDKIAKHMVKRVVAGKEGITLDEANKVMIKYGVTILPIVDKKNHLLYCVFKKDFQKHREFPLGSVDEKHRYMVAAAVSTQPSDRQRIDALIKEETDLIVVDSSDGFSDFQVETLNYIKKRSPRTPVVGGNIITYDGFMHLANAGFDAVKVGMGIGSGCTTQEQKGTGRGQATALIDVVKARNEFFASAGKYIPVIADGSISNPGQLVIALALGADSIMMGRFFAQFTESAGEVRNHPTYGPLKEFWMEASARAHSFGRYDQSASTWFEEGVEGYVPHTGSIYDNLGKTLLKIRSALSNAGCKSVDELHEKAVVELQSFSSLQDAGVHDIIMK